MMYLIAAGSNDSEHLLLYNNKLTKVRTSNVDPQLYRVRLKRPPKIFKACPKPCYCLIESR